MVCTIEMVAVSTGEVLYTKRLGYAFNFVPGDVGRSKVSEIVDSAIRGARIKREPLQLRLLFVDPIDSPRLPFPANDETDPYKVKPF